MGVHLVILAILAAICFAGMLGLVRTSDRQIKIAKNDLEGIDARIMKLADISGCIALQNEIKAKEIDPLLTRLQREYRDRYFIITGIKIMLRK